MSSPTHFEHGWPKGDKLIARCLTADARRREILDDVGSDCLFVDGEQHGPFELGNCLALLQGRGAHRISLLSVRVREESTEVRSEGALVSARIGQSSSAGQHVGTGPRMSC